MKHQTKKSKDKTPYIAVCILMAIPCLVGALTYLGFINL